MDFERLRLRTLAQHIEYVKYELAGGKYLIKIDWGGAHFCEVPSDKQAEPRTCAHGPFVNPDMFLVAVRQLESNRELVRPQGSLGVWKGQTLWYCLDLPKAQVANAA